MATIKSFLQFMPPTGWNIIEEKLSKKFKFENFSDSLEFVNSVAEISEEMNHHPEILINYDEVTISTWTHEQNSITEKDYNLAEKINLI
jgi:4a-hydroxytetrahydrobiopterin dehydratase